MRWSSQEHPTRAIFAAAGVPPERTRAVRLDESNVELVREQPS